MAPTSTELLAPYKSALVVAARDLLRAAGSDGVAIEIPASVPKSVIVLGAEDQIGKLLRTPFREPMLGGRRAGDPPAPALTFDEPEPGDGPLTVDLPDLVMIRRWLRTAAEAGKPVSLAGLAAAALYYAIDTGKPMEPGAKET